MPAHPGRQSRHGGTVQVEGTAVRGVGVERGQSCLPELDQKGDKRPASKRVVAGDALLATPACLQHPGPATLVGLRLELARPVWGPSASNTWKPASWASASFHGSGSRGQRPREGLPPGFLEGQARQHGCRWLGPGRPATQAGPRKARASGTGGLACGRPAPGARRGARARRGLCRGAWAWRAHGGRGPLTSSVTRGCSFPRTWLQGTRCRCCSWPSNSRGRLWGSASPALAWNCNPTLAIFPPLRPRPGCPAPCAPLRPGSAPPRPARPRRPAFAAAAGPRRPAGPTRGARGRRRRRGAGRTAPSGPPLGSSGARAPGTAPALAPTQARLPVGSGTDEAFLARGGRGSWARQLGIFRYPLFQRRPPPQPNPWQKGHRAAVRASCSCSLHLVT